MTGKPKITLSLTDEQKRVVRDATGKDADALELSAQELEDRIAPIVMDTALRLGGLS